MPFKTEHTISLLDKDSAKLRIDRTRGSGDVKVDGVVIPDNVSVLWYIQDNNGTEVPVAQSLRFPIKDWHGEDADQWLKDNKIKGKFDVADEKDGDDREPCFTASFDNAKKELDIVMHGEIGFWGTQSNEFVNMLNENKGIATINLDINSPGGEVFDGFSIYNALKSHKAFVNVNISGIAASIASVIAMAGDKIFMPENTFMMIHKPMVSVWGGNADELRKNATILDKLEGGIIKAYARSDRTEQQLADMLRDETWMDAAEAVEMGFADEVSDEIDIVDFHDLSSFTDVPNAILNSYSAYHGKEFDLSLPVSQDKKTFKDIVLELFNKEIFPTKPRSIEMADTVKLDALQAKYDDQTIKITDLEKKLADAVEVNANLLASIENQAKDIRATEHKAFVDVLVGEGRVRPVDVETHVENMELRYQEDAKAFTETAKATTKLDAYKDMIKEFPVSVDTSGEHVADKGKAKETDIGQDVYEGRATELIAEATKNGQTLSMRDALRKAYEEKK